MLVVVHHSPVGERELKEPGGACRAFPLGPESFPLEKFLSV